MTYKEFYSALCLVAVVNTLAFNLLMLPAIKKISWKHVVWYICWSIAQFLRLFIPKRTKRYWAIQVLRKELVEKRAYMKMRFGVQEKHYKG